MMQKKSQEKESIAKWKKILAALGALYLVAFAAWGIWMFNRHQQRAERVGDLAMEPERESEIVAMRQMASLREVLGLNDEQVAALQDLLETKHREMKALLSQGATDRKTFFENRQKASEKYMAQLKSFLSEEQMAQLETLPPLQRRLLGMGGPPRGGRRGRPDGEGRRGPRPDGNMRPENGNRPNRRPPFMRGEAPPQFGNGNPPKNPPDDSDRPPLPESESIPEE